MNGNTRELTPEEVAKKHNTKMHLWDLARDAGLFVAAVVSRPCFNSLLFGLRVAHDFVKSDLVPPLSPRTFDVFISQVLFRRYGEDMF